MPPSKRHLENSDEDEVKSSSLNNTRPQKIALMQPTTNGFVFSSGTTKQSMLTNKLELVGELKEKAIVPQESMNEHDIPTLGSVLSKRANKSEQSTQSKGTTVSGVSLNLYKPYRSFAPIYNSRGAALSYEDTMMAYTYNQEKTVKTTESTSEEENNIEPDIITKSDSEVPINLSSNGSNESNEFTIREENLAIEMLDCFKDIDIDMIYESLDNEEENNCPITDNRLDENAEMIARLQKLQDKRFQTQTDPDIISPEERILSTKLKNRLAEMISVVPPSKLVSPGAIEKAMAQLPLREAAFKGTLPSNNSRAFPSNEISRDAFNNFTRPSETTAQVASSYSPHPSNRSIVMGPPPPPQPHPPQLKSEIQSPRPPYLQMSSSRGYLSMSPQHGIPRQDGYHSGYHGYPTQYPPHLQRGYSRPNIGNNRSHMGHNWRPGYQ